MSFVTTIRDYIELVNTLYDSISGDLSIQKVIQHTLVFFFETLKYIFVYFISFQWFRDFVYLPIIVPQLSLSVLKENFILDDSANGISYFFQSPFFTTNKFFIGFFNSFFLCLPFSCSNLIVFRRLLIQGIPAGIAASLGSIFSQCFFLASLFFGIRIFFIPWISFDSFQYLLGLFLILAVVYSMSHEIQLTRINSSAFTVLFKIFSINFLLGWTEQSCFFQYIGNLTLSSEPTILETINAKNQIDFFLLHISYLAGILVGSLFFSFCFCFLAYHLTSFFRNFTGILYSESIEKINFILISSIIGLSFASIPFYGLDFLLTNPLGFVSQDKALTNTFFSQAIIKEPLIGVTPTVPKYEPAVDLAPFDRGRYLERDTQNSSFEDLHYEGEYAWKTREDRIKSFSTSSSSEDSDFFLKWIKSLKKSKKKLSTSEYSLENNKKEYKQVDLDFEENDLNLEKDEFDFLANFDENELDFEEDDLNLEKDEFDFLANSTKKGINKKYFTSELNARNEIKTLISNLLFEYLDPTFLKVEPDDSKPEFVALEKKMKQQFYSNPVYQRLLKTDIDSFLSRQPSEYFLTPANEKDLFEKRFLLANYYDTLRYYTQLPYAPQFQEMFQGSKSYSEKIYNQQFKGTLEIVSRLFSITLDTEEKSEKQRVFKYDQPLFNKKEDIFHEESRMPETFKPFFEPTPNKPFYAGWDDKERKFVVTNRFLARPIAGNLKKDSTPTKFTAWPVDPNLVEGKKPFPYTFLFQSLKSSEFISLKEEMSSIDEIIAALEAEMELELKGFKRHPTFLVDEFEQLPTNFSENFEEFSSFFDIVAPKRGGFLWPGSTSKINLSFLSEPKALKKSGLPYLPPRSH